MLSFKLCCFFCCLLSKIDHVIIPFSLFSYFSKKPFLMLCHILKQAPNYIILILTMNITRLNFSQTLPFILETIRQSHYIALDLEMSGIVSSDFTKSSLIDSVQERYSKTRFNINNFIPLQVGLCGYKLNPVQNKVTCFPFNFYVYPLIYSEQKSSQLLFHLGSMKFLAQHKFDFNKLFYQGIPFVSNTQLRQVQKKKENNQIKRQLLRLQTTTSPDMLAFYQIYMPKFVEFVQNRDRQSLQIPIKYVKYRAYKYFLDKVIQLYPSLALKITYDSEKLYQRSKITMTKTIQTQIQKPQELKIEMNSQFMMNNLFQSISEMKKPILVHNGFLDLMHFHHRFHEALPPQWQTYCNSLHKLFPIIYDTKHLAHSSPIIFNVLNRQTNLQSLYSNLKKVALQQTIKEPTIWPKIEIHPDFQQYKIDSLQCHEAGYDAFMTGYSFFRINSLFRKSLQHLIDQQFHSRPSINRNRIPMGNMKVPLNLQDAKQDVYISDSTKKLRFQPVLNQNITPNSILEGLTKQYGPCNYYWQDTIVSNNFYISFLQESSFDKFKNDNLDDQFIGICKNIVKIDKLQGIKFLISLPLQPNFSNPNQTTSQQVQENIQGNFIQK